MSLRKKAVAKMRAHDKILIDGYFRQISRSLNASTPHLVRHICAAYYLDSDELDVNQKHDPIIMSADNCCIHHEVASWNSIVGANICEIGERYQWTLRIMDVMSHSTNTWKILIGIINDDNCALLFDAERLSKKRYFTSIPGSFGFIGSGKGTTIHGQLQSHYGQRFEKKGDCIVVDLDMHKDKHSLSFVINGTEYGKASDVDINTRYRLAVSICKGRKVKLCNMEVMDSEIAVEKERSISRVSDCLGLKKPTSEKSRHKCVIC